MQRLTITRLPSAYSEAKVQLLRLCRRTSFLPKAQEEVLEIKENLWACARLGGVGEHRNTRYYRAAGATQRVPESASFMHLVLYKTLPTGYRGGIQHDASVLLLEAGRALIMSAWERNIQKCRLLSCLLLPVCSYSRELSHGPRRGAPARRYPWASEPTAPLTGYGRETRCCFQQVHVNVRRSILLSALYAQGVLFALSP